jgi:hypothetical protein
MYYILFVEKVTAANAPGENNLHPEMGLDNKPFENPYQ